jgi:hypothetical protein
MGGAIGLRLQKAVLDYRHTGWRGVSHPTGALLQDMGQFVADQPQPGRRLRLVLAGCKKDVRTGGEGQGADPPWLRADMHSHVRKIGAERALHR